jgi:hypothetical protein
MVRESWLHNVWSVELSPTSSCPSLEKTSSGLGRMYDGFHCVQTADCQIKMTSPTASSFGQIQFQTRSGVVLASSAR